MSEYIDKEAFIEDKRKQYCSDCNRRKGMKNGKLKFCYEIGAAPCRACGIDDMLSDVEDYPAADVRPVVRGKWEAVDFRTVKCSKCGFDMDIMEVSDHVLNHANYCPNCGAEMKEGEA